MGGHYSRVACIARRSLPEPLPARGTELGKCWTGSLRCSISASRSSTCPTCSRGALVSVELTVSVMVIGLVFGLIIALMRLSRSRMLRIISTIYVEVIRGTPCLLQLFYIYFVLPAVRHQASIRSRPAWSGLTVNYSAYLSEVYRAGILAVPRGQVEAVAGPRHVAPAKMMRLIDPAAGHSHRRAAARATTSSRCSRTRRSSPRHGEGADVHRSDHCRHQLPVLHDLHDHRDYLPRPVLSRVARSSSTSSGA